MLLDKLLDRTRPDQVDQATVLLVKSNSRRVKLQRDNGIVLWAGYTPENYPNLKEGDPVAVCITKGGAFLVGQVAVGMPAVSDLLDV